MATTRRNYTPGDYDLVVRRSYAGLGLVTESDIPKGVCIIEYFGPQLTPREEEISRSRYLFEVTPRKTIDGSLRANKARYINHSCKGNCEPMIYKGRVYIFSRRKIKAGEELGYDYGKDYFDQFIAKHGCLCVKCEPATLAKRRKEAAKAAKAAAKGAKSI
ncbi:MAG: SET domain-containing protein [Terricaulis sp.]